MPPFVCAPLVFLVLPLTPPALILTVSLPLRFSFAVSVLLLAAAFQYHTICAAMTALSAKPATKPYKISGSGTSCSVVKIRLREPAR